MDTQQTFQSLRIVAIGLIAATLLLLYGLTVAADGPPVIYWHAADNGLSSDVQALDVTSYPGITTTLYAGTWSNGVYRSSDHGVTWLTATAGLTLPMYVKSGLSVNPVTPTILFAGDYFGGFSGVGVYRSTDGGDSWAASLANADIETLFVHPLTPTLVFAGDREDGLYRSSDGGDSWQSSSLPASRVQALAAASVPPGPIYAGADSDLYVSTDGGISWTPGSTLSSTVTALAVHPIEPTHLYAGTRQHGLWRSVDGGTTWLTQTVAGLPSDAWVTSIAIDPAVPTTLYAGVWSSQVYRSQDGGNTWEGLGYLGTVEDVLIHPNALGPGGTSGIIYAATSNNGVFRGSTLDHLTIEPVDSPQYVNHTFPITITAHDVLGFPLTGATQAKAAQLAQRDSALAETLIAGGFDGTAILTDTTGTITPASIAFVDGVATADVVIAAPVSSGTITAAIPSDPGGTVVLPGDPTATSNPFDVVSTPVASFTFDLIADQLAGVPFTITITARDASGIRTIYTGTNILTDTTGTLSPFQVGPFVDGLWSGQVTITHPYSDVVIATGNGFVSGASNSFAVAPNTVSRLFIRPFPMPDQVAGKPFTVTVWAWDPFGDPAIHYNGTLTLTDSTHTLTPITVTFNAGVWNDPVTITQAQNDVMITATADNISAKSTPFDVTATPTIQVDFEGVPRSGASPLMVQFTSTVTGTVTAYDWRFGDDGVADTPHPTHIYESAGSFGVTMVVTGPNGTASESKPGYITVSAPLGVPTATFSADVTSGTAPLTVAFTAITSGMVEHWLWKFGDGNTVMTGPVVSHVYINGGTFDVSLTVSNTHGSYVVSKPNLIHVMSAEGGARLYLPLVLRSYTAP